MAQMATSTMKRRALGVRLRELRSSRRMTAEDVARRWLVSTTKVTRLENGSRSPTERDVRDLCDIYEADPDVREELMTLARESGGRAAAPRSDISGSRYFDLEADASSILDYKSDVIHGLLQTDGYARAVIAATQEKADAQKTEWLIDRGHQRQRHLDGRRPLRVRMVMDEAVLRREVGGPEVMREQLAAMVGRAQQSNVAIQVIPFEVGAHPALSSSFTILHFAGEVPDLVYLEDVITSHYVEGSSKLQRYRSIFDRLVKIAMPPDRSLARIAEISASYEARPGSAAIRFPGDGQRR